MPIKNQTYLLLALFVLCYLGAVPAVSQGKLTPSLQISVQDLGKPHSVSFNHDHQLYISDSKNGLVRLYDQTGKKIKDIKEISLGNQQKSLVNPEFISVSSDHYLYTFDGGSGKLYQINPQENKGREFGVAGNDIGQLGEPIAITSSPDGYLHVLNRKKNIIDVYSPELNYVTWLIAQNPIFYNPRSLSVDRSNRLFILDTNGPVIHILDAQGTALKILNKLIDEQGRLLLKPISIAADHSGGFFIISEDGALLHYNEDGKLINHFRDNKLLTKPIAVAVSPANHGTVAVLDATLNVVQLFSFERSEYVENGQLKLPALFASTNLGQEYYCATAQGTSAFYYIPYNRRDQLVSMTVQGRQRFAIDGYFKEGSDVLWTESGVYVLEEKTRSIFQWSQDGKLVRKFGPELSEKSKNPSSFAAFKNGDILVNDQGKNNLLLFNKEGKFLNQLSISNASAIEKIYINRHNEIFAWDSKLGGIIKADITGKILSTSTLKPRNEKPGGPAGEIGFFVVDPLSQIHLYNLNTSQFEVYQWHENMPQRILTVGTEGDDWFKFSKPKHITFNPSDFELQIITTKGKVYKYQYYFQPPKPENLFGFDVVRDQLKVTFKPLNSNIVTAYGLVTAKSDGTDTLVFGSNSDHFIVDPQRGGWSDKPKRYHLVTVNPTAISPKTEGFDDFFTQATYFDKEEQFDDALLTYQKALLFMGRPASMVKFVASRLNLMGKKMALKGDMHKGMNFIKTAFNLNPTAVESQRSLAYGYDLLFWKLATQENYAEIIKQAGEIMDIDPLRPALLGSIDSVASTLEHLTNERSLNHARLLRSKMTEWEPTSAVLLSKLSATNMRLLDLKLKNGAPQTEMDALLYETERAQKKTIEILQKLKKPFFDDYVMLLNILKLSGKNVELEQEARKLVKEQNTKLSESQMIECRRLLAEALVGQQKYQEATQEYEYLVSSNPNQRQLLAGLAEVHYLNKNYNTARTLYLELITNERENANYIGKLGLIEFQKDNFVEASFQLEKAVRLNPLDKTYYGPLGEAFDQASNLQKALDNYKVAIDHFEQQITQIKNRSLSNVNLQSVEEQLMYYLNKIGKVYEKLGNYDLAIQAYKRVVEQNPKHAEAQYGLGISCLSSGLIYEAVKALFTAKNLQPSDETYNNAYLNAVKVREQISKNSEPLSLAEMHLPAIYPSLYHNYSSLSQLPIGNLVITNNLGEPITPSTLSFFIPEIMDQPTVQKIGALVGYSNSTVNLTALFNNKILSIENQGQYQVQINLTYRYQGASKTATKVFPVTIYPRNAITWSDKRRLASFVSPNNAILTEAQKKIEQVYKFSSASTASAELDKAVQVYTYLNHYGLKYITDPNLNFATVSTNTALLDYLQYPAETLMKSSGDCDDLVTLYCALMEGVGLNVAYLDLPGHVMMAFDLGIRPERLSELGLMPHEVIIYNQSVWIPVETTLLSQAGFITAWDKAAQRYYLEVAKGNNPELITLADARKVYQPSNFIPQNFTFGAENRNIILNEYTDQMYRLSGKINAGILTELQNQIESEPNNIYLKNKYAIILAKSGDIKKAKEILTLALQVAPESPSIHNNLGNIYYQEGNFEGAAQHYLKAHEYDNEDVQTVMNLGKAYLASENKTEAKKWFDQALLMDKNMTSFISKLLNN